MFVGALHRQKNRLMAGKSTNIYKQSSVCVHGSRMLIDSAFREEIQTCHPYGVLEISMARFSTNISPLRGSIPLKNRAPNKRRITLKSGKRLRQFLHYNNSVLYELMAGGVYARMNAAQSSSVHSLNRHKSRQQSGDSLS
jgi:hypothetical protein